MRAADLPPCPKCGERPKAERVDPWPKGHGPAPWHIGCYKGGNGEHYVGGNGDTFQDAMAAWCADVAKHASQQ